MGNYLRVERRQDGEKVVCKVRGRREGGREDDERVEDRKSLDFLEVVGVMGGEIEIERGIRGERFFINKIVGQILVGFCKYFYSVFEVSFEFFLVYYW